MENITSRFFPYSVRRLALLEKFTTHVIRVRVTVRVRVSVSVRVSEY